jgi:NADPH-dependent ferric siderophore reductase
MIFAEVESIKHISPGIIRIVFARGNLEKFEPTPFTDQYINAQFVPEGASYTVPFDLDEARETGEKYRPRSRRVTVRHWNDSTKRLTIDFVVHGDEGFAGPWAKRAQKGDRLQFKGPNGGYSPDPTVDWHLFMGDESALPAISASLESLDSSAKCIAILLVDDENHELTIETNASVQFLWLHRYYSEEPSQLLLKAIQELPFLQGTFDTFVHGEAGEVREIRKHLLTQRGAPLNSSISPYWRRNHTDEAWREVKKEWLTEQVEDL